MLSCGVTELTSVVSSSCHLSGGGTSVRILAAVVSLLPSLSRGWWLPMGQGADLSSPSGFSAKKDQQIQRDSGKEHSRLIKGSLKVCTLPFLG